MKKNFILGLAAISMLSFASCETDPAAEKNLASDVVEGIPTTATITLTNAPSTMATESGESNESQIDNATLYVFNNADVLESIVPFQQTDIQTKKVTFQTTTGAKTPLRMRQHEQHTCELQFQDGYDRCHTD